MTAETDTVIQQRIAEREILILAKLDTIRAAVTERRMWCIEGVIRDLTTLIVEQRTDDDEILDRAVAIEDVLYGDETIEDPPEPEEP